eukprot:TRINITY_DN2604_c0_g1_i3.p1 TRINITY_DN2604_c0_g1~~TRINITY_DN2604_c0_g1_i3.p1  ORF type:complete len:450 (+),score=105.40 TRINITY_DN2604_c0_g1_i3:968-2317(+)
MPAARGLKNAFTPPPPPPSPPPLAKMIYDSEHLRFLIEQMAGMPWTLPSLEDYWSTQMPPKESWVQDAPITDAVAVDRGCTSAGYRVEANYWSVTHDHAHDVDELTVVDPHRYFPFYQTFFANTEHDNYCVKTQDGSPFIVSIEQNANEESFKKVIVWSKAGPTRVLIPATESISYVSHLLKLDKPKFTKVTASPGIVDDLSHLEQRSRLTTHKFGVLYIGPNQKNEEDTIFGNQHGSALYDEFLDFLGDRIELKGWTKFRGGLDVRDDTTGKHSVYTQFRDFEVMFHVCTLLPFQECDRQKVERKRHIGNDVVVLVFKEQATPDDVFSPSVLTSHFNHCFFVVSPVATPPSDTASPASKAQMYTLSVVTKQAVSPFHPFLPKPPVVFWKTPQFHEFLLLKMINAERTAIVDSPEFRGLMTARSRTLTDVIQRHTSRRQEAPASGAASV